ncbi:lactoylglutathione lyase [Teredinibacter sp. KSP-S5-2]|uniref:lactoylglutathione lyase n=1 Tax=Teredinibacter sp. KSP-S5-2 TaxID=3034506 RepID=UPI00293483A1|nr:lactoylglutathione lyase [Teredinibacter sp. KSP-S5-2]WNO07752.1 lactoylglutathione lyase [Teredinibacter sp. KSP-S5-2]
MKFLHSMIRVTDVEKSLHFYTELLGLKLLRKKDYPQGRFTLYYLATEEGEPEIEFTHNWDTQEYTQGNNFGHFAFQVDNIYQLCERLEEAGITILRPPRDGHMAFIKDPNGISIELLQAGDALPPSDKWRNRESVGSW